MRDEEDPARAGQRDPGQDARTPWWKHPLVWVGSVIGALFIAIATTFGNGIGQDLFSATVGHHTASGRPVEIDSVQYEESAVQSYSFAFPQRLTNQQAAALNSGQDNCKYSEVV